MAELGQCKTCRREVSTEAISCPHCGQPNPAITIPLHGTVHFATIYTISLTNGSYSDISVIFQNGLLASVAAIEGKPTDLCAGKTVKVKVAHHHLATVIVNIVY